MNSHRLLRALDDGRMRRTESPLRCDRWSISKLIHKLAVDIIFQQPKKSRVPTKFAPRGDRFVVSHTD